MSCVAIVGGDSPVMDVCIHTHVVDNASTTFKIGVEHIFRKEESFHTISDNSLTIGTITEDGCNDVRLVDGEVDGIFRWMTL